MGAPLVLTGGSTQPLPERNQTRTPTGTAASPPPRELLLGPLGKGAGALPAKKEKPSRRS